MVMSKRTLFHIYSQTVSVFKSTAARPAPTVWPVLTHNKLCVFCVGVFVCAGVCVRSYGRLSSRRLSRIWTRLSSPNTYPRSGPSCTAVSPRNPLKVEWAKSIIRTSTRGGRCGWEVGGGGKEIKLGAGEEESGRGWAEERGGRKEWQSDLVGGACGRGWGEGTGGDTSPDPWEDSDPGSGFWLESISQGAPGAGDVWVPGPQWGSAGAAGVFCCVAAFGPELRAEGPSGSYTQNQTLISRSLLAFGTKIFPGRSDLKWTDLYCKSVRMNTNWHVLIYNII